MSSPIVEPALRGSVTEFYNNKEANLVDRWHELGEWFEARNRASVDPYQKYSCGPILPVTRGSYRDGRPFEGVNFASQDYLSLSSHAAIKNAVITAMNDYGLHSAGSAALMGNTYLSIELERILGEYLGYSCTTLFSTGWGAGYGVVKTLLREGDHVIIDALAHACLQEAAVDSRAHVHRHPHLSTVAVERRLRRIRASNTDVGILVVAETLYSMDSDVPDLKHLQELCKIHGATLLVDCAHDLGALGKSGKGFLEEQEMWGKVDVLMGSFSKTFASTGGFVACNSPGLRFGLRAACGPSTFTNAMSPLQAAIVLESLRIVRSEEGQERRDRLMSNIVRLRQGLADNDFKVLGAPSPIVPMVVGSTPLARMATRFAVENGGIVNLVEHPAVSRNSDRWRLQVMADHTNDHVDRMVQIAVQSREMAEKYLSSDT
ncbi:aminotransferase class I/II-fold pyridoxal phosphate-dependent enzyme [Methylorubrum extorquens]|uniref:aminotransferase class I/II-fold pyridoxal phosphate-dependent enzyme n=1 Tax=Methylorubrum extorquens TaxID=408 RepID=UPI002237C0E3|nr:aminotransferase class I/II-fold pyridoxal phosphate-dependent enzyme [Methylorubrum extorquens]UYW29493.1 aminotransferase class I/II-fold pyridoxal phosphate-dependent enzyme [Methylorubrum extorquens]